MSFVSATKKEEGEVLNFRVNMEAAKARNPYP